MRKRYQRQNVCILLQLTLTLDTVQYHTQAEDQHAKICAIRSLPKPDQRKLLGITWLYPDGNKFRFSNHL